MKLRIVLIVLLIMTSFVVNVATASEDTQLEIKEKTVSQRYALLIGIEDYPETSNDLGYCLDDVYDVREALVSFCNFSNSNIRILADSKATKINIKNAVAEVAENTSNNDIFIFFYSGHGSSGGKLAPYDFKTQGTISSGELDSWLNEVNSSNIVIALDCCFAGAFVSKNVRCVFEKVKEQGNFIKGIAREGRIICAACNKSEYSWEFDELENGAFSYYFAQGLQSLRSDTNKNDWISCEEAFKSAKPKVEEFVRIYANATQIPQVYDGIAGELDLAFFNVSKDILVSGLNTIENKNLLLRGNLTVLSQGMLELSNTTLVLLPSRDGEFQINIEPNADLEIYNSTITSWDYNKHYLFCVESAKFKMENSSLRYCGYSRKRNGLNIKNCSNVEIKNSSFSDNFFGLTFEFCEEINVNNSKITRNNDYGLVLVNCRNATINNSKALNDEINICLDSSSNISILNCRVSKGNYGIWFFNSSANRIAHSNICDNWYGGIRFSKNSMSNIVTDCLICNNNEYGMWLDFSSNNILARNALNNNFHNLVVLGSEIFDFYQEIDVTNTINTRPIYYLVEEGDRNFSNVSLGYVGLISCENITLRNLRLANNIQGLLLVNTSYSTISGNKIFDNYRYGIYLHSSSHNVIIDCNIYNNSGYGIYVCKNSTGNLIYRNNFINNEFQAFDECNNEWDDGSVGNYWSNYQSEDLDYNGICDSYYSIPGGDNKDSYPLFEPLGMDTIPPKIIIKGVTNNTWYNTTVTPIVEIFDMNLNLSSITLNSKPFTSGASIAQEGNYTLIIQACDSAGNIATEVLVFIIDKSEPNIVIKNVTDGAHYRTNVTPEIVIYDLNLQFSSIKLNSKDFISGSELSEESYYTLFIEALDKAGNLARLEIHFVIDKTEPLIEIISPEDGLTTTNSVALIYFVYDNFNALENITVNIKNGTVFYEEGSYLIYVYARDSAGNTVQKSARFRIISPLKREEIAQDPRIVYQNTIIAAIAIIIIVFTVYIFKRVRR